MSSLCVGAGLAFVLCARVVLGEALWWLPREFRLLSPLRASALLSVAILPQAVVLPLRGALSPEPGFCSTAGARRFGQVVCDLRLVHCCVPNCSYHGSLPSLWIGALIMPIKLDLSGLQTLLDRWAGWYGSGRGSGRRIGRANAVGS